MDPDFLSERRDPSIPYNSEVGVPYLKIALQKKLKTHLPEPDNRGLLPVGLWRQDTDRQCIGDPDRSRGHSAARRGMALAGERPVPVDRSRAG